MKKIIRAASIILSAAIFFSISACTERENGDAAGEEDGQVIKIGGIGPLTGSSAIYGQSTKNGAQIAVEEINERGGIKFALRYEDDENDTEKAVNAYNKLKDWGMKISLGTVTTQPCIAVSAELNEDWIFAITPSASSTDVIGGQPDADGNMATRRKDNMFQMCFTDPNQGIASAQYIKERGLGERIAVIYNNSDAYSTGIYQKFMTEADRIGLNVVSVKSFTDDSASDFTSQLNEIKAAGADLVFLPIYYSPASLILAQADRMRFEPKFFGVDGLDGILTIENFDISLAEGVMLLTPFTADSEDELTQSFVAKYREKYSETPNQFAADGYDAVIAIYQACLNKNITPDMSPQDICDALVEEFTNPEFKVDGLTGSGMTWSETGEISKSPKGMIIQNGVYVGM